MAIALSNARQARQAAKRAEDLAAELRAMEKDKLAWAIMQGFAIPDVKRPGQDPPARPRGSGQ